MIEHPMAVIATLLTVLAALFGFRETRAGKRVFKVVPLLVFAYFVPTALSNLGIIPLRSEGYTVVKKWLLPASLVLLTLSVDIPSILKLGKQALWMFLGATITVVVGGPLAYLALYRFVPAELGDQAWKGLAALAGSWIGGGANFVAIGASVGASDETIGMMVVVDVVVASLWMAVLLSFAGRHKAMDGAIGADGSAIDRLREKVEQFRKAVTRPLTLGALLAIVAIGLASTALASHVATLLPEVGDIINEFTWVVLLVTALGLGLSFTPARKLEGSGASTVGSAFLYLLVATIGAKAEFASLLEVPGLVAVGALWMGFHAAVMLALRRYLKAPVFFLAVGSQANIGGAASAPVVAGAFHPALAPVGVLLAVGGYVLGTYAGLLCAFLLEQVHLLMGG